MTQDDAISQTLDAELQTFVGRPTGPPVVARDPVNLPMIRHLTDALGDRNPCYTNEAFAARSVHGGIVAPPTSLQVWTMPGLAGRPSPEDDAQRRLMQLLDEAGYVGVVATNCEQVYHRYLRLGDLITGESIVESITGPKRTSLGEGYFITTLHTYRDQNGEVVGEMRFRILKFRPALREGSWTPSAPPPRDAAFFWEGVEARELRIQRCSRCRRLRHPPRPMCPSCLSPEWDYVVASGKGEVYSYVVHHRPEVPGRTHPFVIVLVQLEEGTRIVGNLLDCDPAEVRMGMPLELVFARDQRGRLLPQWRPA